MILKRTLCALLFFTIRCLQIECRSYNNGLIFYDLESRNTYLPPTISVSRGRGLAKYQYSPRGSIWSTFGKPCNCNGPLCGCCVGIKVKQYNFDQKMCANVSYALPRDEVQLEVFLNDTATAKYGISARNPSPLCVPIMMGIPMSMCIQMSNIGVQGDNLNMCMDFLVRLASTEIFEMHFQCMKVGLQGASWVGSDGQPVIPANEGKLKDKTSADSDEYYDESETENEISTNEDEVANTGAVGMEKDNNIDKTAEEMDNNDITEQIMGIVKETEQQATNAVSKGSEENKVDGMFGHIQDNKNVEAIVTNIMDSINQANTKEEIEETENMRNEINKSPLENINEMEEGNSNEKPASLEAEDSDIGQHIEDFNNDEAIEMETNDESQKGINKDNNKLQESMSESDKTPLKQKINDMDKTLNAANSADFLANKLQDEFNVEELFDDSQEKEKKTESNQVKTQEIELPTGSQEKPQKVMTPIIVLEETTTEGVIQDQILESNDDTEHNKLLQIIQPTTMETQKTTLTTTTSSTNAMANSLAAAAATKTTTIKTVATTNKPTKLDANFEVPATVTNNIEMVADDHSEDEGEEEEEEEDDDENSGDNDDNSHENDSDYEDEESDETENETKEKTIAFNNATTIVKSNAVAANGNEPKESVALKEDANNSNSNESQSAEDDNENTHDEFETEEGEEYDDEEEEEYEDYETTTAAEAALKSKEFERHKSTCCKPVMTILTTIKPFKHNHKNAESPQTETAPSHNIHAVNMSNDMVSQTGDQSLVNTKSTNKMSQATIDSTGTASTALESSRNAASGSVMPLPLARKLPFSALHQQQQSQQHKRQQRQRQHYV